MYETAAYETTAYQTAAPAPSVGPDELSQDVSRREAAAALQRALDRRDNGGATGH